MPVRNAGRASGWFTGAWPQRELGQVKAGFAIAVVAAAFLSGAGARAQPADLPIPPATTREYPPGVTVGTAGGGPVYVARDGRTLYGMDMRTLLRFGADPSQYCQAACADLWEPLLAPADAVPNLRYPTSANPADQEKAAGVYVANQKAPDWTVIKGPQGAQWVYKGWHVVFVRKGDAPGSAAYEGEDNRTWNTLKFVPPAPKVTAPVNVSTAFVGGAYALVDDKGRLLFTGSCAGAACAGWRPFAGGMASRGLGEWTVGHTADSPQWSYRGRPVFVAEGTGTGDMPPGAALLRP